MKTKLFKNFFSLGGIQALNLLIPLLISPFVISKVGLPVFGLISIAQVAAGYGNILTNYGFQVTAVREIATLPTYTSQELSLLFNKYFFCTLFLLAIALFMLAGVTFLFAEDPVNRAIYGSSIFIVIGQALLPLWFFQGLNQVKQVFIPILIGRLTGMTLILLFVKNQDQAPYVNLFLGVGNIIASLFLMFRVIKAKYAITLSFPGVQTVQKELTDGFFLFLSNIGANIYASSGILFLGYLTNPLWVGVFAVCDRVIQLTRAILGFFFQATYPVVCQSAVQGKRPLKVFFVQIYPYFWACVCLGCIILFFFSDQIAAFFVQNNTASLVNQNLRKCSFIPLIVALNIPFYQTLLVYTQDKLYSKVLIFFSVLSLFLYWFGILSFGIDGLVTAIYVVETGVTLSLIYFATLFFEQYELA